MTISISNIRVDASSPLGTVIGILEAQNAYGDPIECNFSISGNAREFFSVSPNKLLTDWKTTPADGFYSVRVHSTGISQPFFGSATFAISVLNPASPPLEPIPPQSAGPRFTIGSAGQIALAAPYALDAMANDIDRIRQFLPLVRRAADDLAATLNPNQFTALSRNLSDYRTAIAADVPEIAWGIVFGLGVRLANAADAAQRQIEDRLIPTLEDPAQEALQSLNMLHGSLIMATAEGRELEEQADRLEMPREQQALFRADAVAIAAELHRTADVIEPQADKIIAEAAEIIAEGPRAERGTAFGLATFKHVIIVLVSAGTAVAMGAAVGGGIGGIWTADWGRPSAQALRG